MKLFYNYLLLAVCIQLVAYMIWAFDWFGGLVSYPLGDVASLTSIFDINVYTVLIAGVGAAAIGLAAVLLRQGIYALYAMLLWAIGVMFKIVSTFVLVIPNMITAFLPASTNPNPALFPVNPLIVIISFIFVFAAWWYLFGLVIQRDQN
jgi:hypothetical protein